MGWTVLTLILNVNDNRPTVEQPWPYRSALKISNNI